MWRPMTETDLPRVGTIAAVVHPGFPEDDAVFAERLRLYPQGCHVFVQDGLAQDGLLTGYVLSHPWAGAPPALNSLLQRLPQKPDTYYIHDLALMPAARGSGAGRRIVTQLIEHAQAAGLPRLALVAVNNSAAFWQQHGFMPRPGDAAKLASYGADARFMHRILPPT